MSKVKEQVRYNPKLSEASRVYRVQKFFTGKAVNVATGVILGFGLFMFAALLIGSAFDTKGMLEGEGGTLSLFIFNGTFAMYMFVGLGTVFPANSKTDNEYKSSMKGCVSTYYVLSTLPVSKVSVVKSSFRRFLLGMSILAAVSVILNIEIIFIEELEIMALGETGFVSFVLAIAMAAFYLTTFVKFVCRNKLIEKLSSATLVVFYIVWIGSMFGFFNKIYTLAFFEAVAGVPAIVITAVSYVATITVHKLCIERRSKGSGWTND